jgi:hypothetical protein
MKLDSTWIAERFLSDGGGYAEREAELFVNGARKAGLPDCVPADKLKDMPNLIRASGCSLEGSLGSLLEGRHVCAIASGSKLMLGVRGFTAAFSAIDG